jgi:4a-hydroxytetrahydrobiopterin dehydratase
MQKSDKKPVQKTLSDKEVKGSPLLTINKARESLKNLEGWQLTDDHKMLYREFILKDFKTAIDLIDRIALIAEDEKHHPDIHLTQYRNLRIGLTTHEVGGLSEKDFAVALKIKDLPILSNKHNPGVVADQPLKTKDKPNKKKKVTKK